MVFESDFTWIVIAPGGPANMPLACEAVRAGAWGFVDLEDIRDADELQHAFSRLGSEVDVSLGVKLDAVRHELWEPLLAAHPPQLTRVILARPGGSAELRAMVSRLQRLELEVLVEAVSVDEAIAADQAGAGGIIAKGSEAGGRIGDETSFLLLQRLSGLLHRPLYAQGGVGLHTAAACHVAGASGAVLDWQLCLVEESQLGAPLRLVLSRLDGSETAPVGLRLGEGYRLYLGPGRTLLPTLQEQEHRLATSDLPEEERLGRWRGVIDETLAGAGEARKLGMDVSFAARLAAKFRTVGGVLGEMDRSLRFHLSRAREAEPLGPEKGMAGALGTRYPIVQGPMSRVSDTPAFAAEVAAAGGLPVMAIAAMREDEMEPMLRDTAQRLGDAPWGAGLLGFLPPELYGAQVELVKKYRPPTVVIAGGQPVQAQQFEALGIRTFIHVPSHRLLDLYLDDGIQNVIFEGLECGGHIGRYSGFVLWENVIEVMLARILRDSRRGRCGALFAGGISTALSGAMISALVAPLADRGVDVGVLVGTGYLFTHEAVECGAINSGFQSAIVAAQRTAILDCGGGYQIRAAPNPFCGAFEEEKQRLIAQGLPAEEVRMSLEHLTLGRLRMAAKGLRFNEKRRHDPAEPLTLEVPEAEQQRDGVYMAGQAILLHDSVYSVRDLHRRICEDSAGLFRAPAPDETRASVADDVRGMDIAIVGMSGLFPGARDLDAYWENILAGKYSITEVPKDRWDTGIYFDADPKSRDKIYSRWGGFLEPIEFDPLKFGIPPKAVSSIDPFQLLTLELVDRALRDAGYDQRWFDREHTSVFVGEAGGGNLGQLYCLRSLLPMVLRDVPEAAMAQLPEWTEDSFPGLLPNVIAGRVANQFDLGGTNLSTSAACAAGLAALSLGMDELRSGKSRMSIVAAVDVAQNPYVYMSFSKTMALSPTGTPRCFDASGDGIVISQGVGVVILKRLEDAERDGDRIYAVVRGVGSSSDGRGKSLTAPTSRGQMRAIRRAYEQAGFGLDTVELFEAHGTGTVLGDRTEAESITFALREAGAAPKSCAVGTVKSMIGHTKGCAGIASLIKVALSLHHKVLPPTLWVKTPIAAELWAGDSPAYLNTELRPWVGTDHARRAGVSSFGFGGTNFHAVLEEHRPPKPVVGGFPNAPLPAELFCFSGSSVEQLRERVEEVRRAAAEPASLRDLAHRAFLIRRDRGRPDDEWRVSVVAESVPDLARKLEETGARLAAGPEPFLDPTGAYFAPEALGRKGKVAFIFPGQGSQRVDMLRDLTLLFGELRDSFAVADRILASRLPFPLSQYVYPPASFTEEERSARMQALTRTDVTQPALGAAGLGLYKVLRAFGVRPDMAAGHSVGEYVALCAAGVLSEESLYDLLWARGSCMLQAAGEDAGTMMAIRAARETVEESIRGEEQIFPANFNAPLQTVVSGRREGLEALQARLAAREIESRLIPVGCGFHSPFVAEAAKAFASALEPVPHSPARFPVYSNYLAAPFPEGEAEARKVLSAHLSHPVRFMDEIQRMYEDGARVFLEVGPGRVCGNLVGEILHGKPHAVVSCDGAPSRVGAVRFLHALGQMFAHGLELRLDPLFNRREVESRSLVAIPGIARPLARPKVTWMVSPEVSWPAGTARPQMTPVSATLPATVPLASAPLAPAPPAAAPLATASRGNGAPAAAAGGSTTTPAGQVGPVRAHANGPVPPPGPGSSVDGSGPRVAEPRAEVVLRHQKLMASFLEQQKQVMLAYLGSQQTAEGDRPTRVQPAAAWTQTPPATIVQPAAARTQMPPATIVEPAAARTQTPPAPAVRPVAEIASPPPPPAVEPATASAAVSEDLLPQLVALVAERTGYPTDMLAPEQDMEADLGIDSIKRVEILTSFARQFPNLGPAVPEKLRAARTLEDVVHVMRENLAAGPAAAAPDPPAPPAPAVQPVAKTARVAPGGDLGRYTLALNECAVPDGAAVPIPDGALVITDDGRGYAAGLRERLLSRGGRPVIVRLEGPEAASDGVYAADLADPDQVEALLQRIRRDHGRIGGVVHLLPLRSVPPVQDLSAAEYGRLLNQEVKGLFYLLSSASADLRSVAGSWALTGLSFGASSANGSLPVPDHPWRGGLIGVIKTVTVEWRDVVAKSLVLEDAPIDQALGHILAELGAPRQEREAYYRGGTRLVPEPRKAPLQTERTFVDLRPEDVIVLIGGARGITSEVAREMAAQARPTLILVGRSPWPAEEESDATARAASDGDLKRILFGQLQAQGRRPSPRDLDAEARRILREREMRASRSAMEAAGSRVLYHQADIRDEASTEALFRRIYEAHGRIDGLVCGAGIIEDKLIEDKTPESFDRVFDTKAMAIFHLARSLRPESLRFCVIFSSVAGWAGNRGQVDYVAANEVLNRMALHLSARWNRRVVAIDWGPWEKAGMVTAEIRRQFLERGVGLVPPDAGRRFTLDEIRFGDPSEIIVAALGGPGVDDPAAAQLSMAAIGEPSR